MGVTEKLPFLNRKLWQRFPVGLLAELILHIMHAESGRYLCFAGASVSVYQILGLTMA